MWQGGCEFLAALAGLAMPRDDVASSKCLGRCGTGSNFATSVVGEPVRRRGGTEKERVDLSARLLQLKLSWFLFF